MMLPRGCVDLNKNLLACLASQLARPINQLNRYIVDLLDLPVDLEESSASWGNLGENAENQGLHVLDYDMER